MAPIRTALLGGALVAALLVPTTANAASSKGCDKDVGFAICASATAPSSVKPDFDGTIAASRLEHGPPARASASYVTFDLDPTTFARLRLRLHRRANPLDITGGRRIVAYAGKVPDHRGLTLTSGMTVELDKDDGLEIGRTGTGLSMKIQAKDCANGGALPDGARARRRHRHADHAHARRRTSSTTTTRTSAPARATSVPYKDTTVTVAPA